MLKDSDFDFRIRVVDPDYDNDDNPYGEIKLHRYNNIQDMKNILKEGKVEDKDDIIPLKRC